jgi:hypothetical protein
VTLAACLAVLVFALGFVGSVLGCTPTIATYGIPNFAPVRVGVWRGGQPSSPASWKYLAEIGVRHVIKLNMDDEGSDDGAAAYGIEVHHLGIQPAGDTDIFDEVAQTFVRPDPVRIATALDVLRGNTGVFVHCTHGQDRTGLVIGMDRVREDGYTKDKAYAEMLKYGFHPLLHGLHETWETWKP